CTDTAGDWPAVDDVRSLSAADLPRARELIADGFGLQTALGAVALPDTDDPGWLPIGAFSSGRMVAAGALSAVGEVHVGWSVAVARGERNSGHGRRLTRGMIHAAKAAGARTLACEATAMGEPLYASLGFVEVERWQLWSRARWALARA
ncbi:MAG: GNAT family N-acetyltransferase, partial [Solirubrobacteraceae bacterium]